jgi:hypothetical protein
MCGWTARRRRYLGLLSLALLVLVHSCPVLQPIPGADSGTFLYAGRKVLEGQTPYRDVWDHKGPLVFYLDALGLLIGGDSLWGVWFLELAFVAAAACLGYAALRQAFGGFAAAFASAVWLIHLPVVLLGGNFTEQFALPFQFGALYLFERAESASAVRQRTALYFLVGTSAAGAALLRPNLIGVHVAVAAFVVLSSALSRTWRDLLRVSLAMFLGAAVVLGAVGAFFASRGALGGLIDAMFLYNFEYVATPWMNKARSFFEGVYGLWGICSLAMAAWVMGWLRAVTGDRDARQNPLLLLALIALPFEFFMSSLSGRWHFHYFMAWLPALAVLVAYFSSSVLGSLKPQTISVLGRHVSAAHVWALALTLAVSLVPMAKMAYAVQKASEDAARILPVVDYVAAETGVDDYLLIWGTGARINFLAGRDSPTRFVYHHLVRPGYQSAATMEELLSEVAEKRPVIVETAAGTRISAEGSSASGGNRELSAGLSALVKYVRSNYEVIGTAGPERWPVYRHKEAVPD